MLKKERERVFWNVLFVYYVKFEMCIKRLLFDKSMKLI